MIASLYIIDYFRQLGEYLDAEHIPYHPNLIHVPGGSASDFMDYLAKREIINSQRKPDDPVFVIGWDKGTTNRMSEARPHLRSRYKQLEGSPTDIASIRHAIQGMFTLSVFCICNKGNLVEDFEESYSTIIRPRTCYKVDTKTIYELAAPEFRVNMLHGDVSTTCLNSNGNIWGVSWSVNLFGDIVNLVPSDAAKCKKLSVELYENNLDLHKFITKISIDNNGKFL